MAKPQKKKKKQKEVNEDEEEEQEEVKPNKSHSKKVEGDTNGKTQQQEKVTVYNKPTMINNKPSNSKLFLTNQNF